LIERGKGLRERGKGLRERGKGRDFFFFVYDMGKSSHDEKNKTKQNKTDQFLYSSIFVFVAKKQKLLKQIIFNTLSYFTRNTFFEEHIL